MSECAEVVSLLSDYLNRELPPETCAVLDAHLQRCDACREKASGLRQTVALCRQFRAEDVPGPLADERREELRSAFERVLRQMQGR
jgi:anti-sigma factor RsiW